MSGVESCAPAAALVRLRNVSLRRGTAEVLRDISFDIPVGRITAVVGRSGVGKTTLLAALNGLIKPACGEIVVGGIGSLAAHDTLLEHRRRTATIFQEHALIDRLHAIDNVLLGLADRRHPLSLLPWPEEMRRQAAQALSQVGLLHRATARSDRLSGGERQRVGVARALVRQPKLLLGDEPFASVDPLLVVQIGDTLRTLANRYGVTVVLVLHQIETARALADKVVGLADGQVVYDGPAAGFDALEQQRVFAAGERGTLH